ncbi:MAG TPA: hypothetical protein VKG92_09870, partial [Flavobacteriales bacterium]|nr:hypothetical protein [Flavobacteriales bacterium]
FTTLQANTVLSKRFYPTETNWDTLYYLGVPGDRWWPLGIGQGACGHLGMLQIQDTGHVTIDDVYLRTWRIAILDSAGIPTPVYSYNFFEQDSVAIIERIGAVPGRAFLSIPCNPDYSWDP